LVVAYLPIIYFAPLGRDQGVFAYTGKIILQGGLPYIDSWDHKGPLIYYLNYVGLLLHDVQGIFLFELIWNCIFFYLATMRVSSELRKKFSFALIFGVLSYLFVMQGANLTETWALGPQVLSYSVLLFALENQKFPNVIKSSIRINTVLFCICFFLRPNNSFGVLLSLCICISLFLKNEKFILKKRKLLNKLLLLLASVVSLVGINKYLFDLEFFEQYFAYNTFYSLNLSQLEKIDNAFFLMEKILKLPITAVLLLIIVVYSRFLMKPNIRKVFRIPIFIYLADLIGIFISGKPWLHYLVLIIPGSIILIYSIFKHINFEKKVESNYLSSITLVFLIVIAMPIVETTRWYSDHLQYSLSNKNSTIFKVSQYVKQETNVSDYIYVFGAETGILVEPFRKSSSSISYIYPLLLESKNQSKYVKKVLEDIELNPPKLIFQSTRFCIQGNSCITSYPIKFQELPRFIDQNYYIDGSINSEFKVWKPRNSIDSLILNF
jgi:hypothetical protein